MNGFSSRPLAVAEISGGNDAPMLHGEARFYHNREGVLVVVIVDGLPESNESGFFGLHIHESDSCFGEGFPSTGGHYNPDSTAHPMHAGDLPPLLRCNGGAYLATLTDRFHIEDIIGRTIVIHSAPDDFRSQPSGNAGKKIACGQIRRR